MYTHTQKAALGQAHMYVCIQTYKQVYVYIFTHICTSI